MLKEDNLNTIEVLISMALIDSYISHDEFVSIINELGECMSQWENVWKKWYRNNSREKWNAMVKYKSYKRRIRSEKFEMNYNKISFWS